MSIVNSMLGYRKFWSEEKIRDLITKSKNFNSEYESIEKSDSLLLFETSKQRTWLVSTSDRLYCILDDARNERPKLQWSIMKSDLLQGSDCESSIKTKTKTEKTGLVDFGTKHRNWLYSTRLFTSSSLERQLSDLLTNT